jgi:hypothetical protein
VAAAHPVPRRYPLLAMKLLLALSALLVGSLAAPSHTLRFSPAEGTELKRSLSFTVSSATESAERLLDGGPAEGVPDVGFSSERTVEVTVTDRLERVAEGRPATFVRRFEDLYVEFGADLTVAFGDDEAELELTGDGTSALEGEAVRFTWSEDSSDWKRTYAEEDAEAPAAMLEPLRGDMDFLALLPTADAVDIGDEWDVPLDRLVDVLFPGGVVGLVLETDLDRIEGVLDPSDLPDIEALMREGELEGEARCKLTGVEGENALVTLDVDLTARGAFVDRAQELADSAAPEGVDVEISAADWTVTLEGKGTLSFALTRGHVSRFEFEGTTREESRLTADVVADGQKLPFEQNEIRSGTLRSRMTIE